MPSLPKLGDASGEIRLFEVFHQGEAHDLGGTDGDVGIGAKVAVDLDPEQERRDHELKSGVLGVIAIDLVDNYGHTIRDHELQKEPPQHDQKARFDSIIIEVMPFVDLHEQILGTLDRTRHELWEERYEKRILRYILFNKDFPPVHIHRVAQCLESVERDADRQNHIKSRLYELDAQASHDPAKIAYGKVKVFEKKENRQIGRKTETHPEFSPEAAL